MCVVLESMNGGCPNKSFLVLSVVEWNCKFTFLYLVLNKFATPVHLLAMNVLFCGELNANCLNVNFHLTRICGCFYKSPMFNNNVGTYSICLTFVIVKILLF